MTDMTPGGQQDFAAMQARVYSMTQADRERWYAEHPLSMYATEPVVLLDNETAESDAAILRAAARVLKRRYNLFTNDLQSGLHRAAQHIETTQSPV